MMSSPAGISQGLWNLKSEIHQRLQIMIMTPVLALKPGYNYFPEMWYSPPYTLRKKGFQRVSSAVERVLPGTKRALHFLSKRL